MKFFYILKLKSQGRCRCTGYFCAEAGFILAKLEIFILIADCTGSNGKPLLPRVLVINLISSSSLDLEQIIKALCERDLAKLIFCLVGQKESQKTHFHRFVYHKLVKVVFLHIDKRKQEVDHRTNTSRKNKEELVFLSSVNLRFGWTLLGEVKIKSASISPLEKYNVINIKKINFWFLIV